MEPPGGATGGRRDAATEARPIWQVIALPFPFQRKPFQQIIQLQLRRLPPIEDRLDDVRREQRQPQIRLT